MNIMGTTYSLKDRALDIFIAGCSGPHCNGCHNPASWNFNTGEPLVYIDLINKITRSLKMTDHIRIMGGEPLDQPIEEIKDFIMIIAGMFGFETDIWLFTRRDLNEVPKQLIPYIDYIKCGHYMSDRPPRYDRLHGIKLGSANQRIYDLRGVTTPLQVDEFLSKHD